MCAGGLRPIAGGNAAGTTATLSFPGPAPGDGVTCPASLSVLANMMNPTDLGPPALPILMVRAARRAVAENPLDAASQLRLLEANETLYKLQEDYWTHNYGSGKLRSRL